MVRTVEESNLERLYLVACKDAVGHSLGKSFFYARNKFLRHVSTLDLFVELKTDNTFISRTDLDKNVSKLTTTTGLLLEHFLVLNGSGNGFLVVDLRSTLVDLEAELTAETVDDDVKVKLTHTADDGLACIRV